MQRLLLTPILIASLFSTWVTAGGPFLSGPGGAFRWDPGQGVAYRVDPGPVGSGISNQEGVQIIADAFAVWTSLPTSRLEVVNAGPLPTDVNANNFLPFLLNPGANGNPIIFDADGGIIDAVFGPGASGSVLGFAGSEDSDGDGFFDSGVAVLNGLEGSTDRNSPFFGTGSHEFGHFLGMDHTQAGRSAFEACSLAMPDVCLEIPLMFPIAIAGVPATVEPLADDRSWFSWLYPSADFRTTTATIRGRVSRRSGVRFQSANLVAVPVEEQGGQLIERESEAVSSISDFLVGFNGNYEIPGLPPGDYVIRLEPLDENFTGGSGIGTFNIRFVDFPEEFFNGENESGDPSDDPQERTVLSVAAGQVLGEINLVSNDLNDEIPEQALEQLGDDDSRHFIFPEGFRFPFYGRLYRGVFVNSDGNLTFEAPDSDTLNTDGTFVIRNEARFLGGPPRIAPLYTDLDPSFGGTVASLTEGDNITFFWNGVPEFGALPGQTNSFSVTLFSNGDIRFLYDNVSLTPDNLSAPFAIIGVSPGNGASGQSVDLSRMGQLIGFGEGPLYEDFNGNPDILGLQLDASDLRLELLFPFYSGGNSNFSGFAVTNDSDDTASLEIEALNDAGVLQAYPVNPGMRSLNRGKQLAQLGSEFFGLGFNDLQDGWVRMRTQAAELASFFQFGNGISRLDGSVAFTETSNVLYFTRLAHGPGSFETPVSARDAVTRIALANPGDETVNLTLRLFRADGSLAGDANRQLVPGACLLETLEQLFGTPLVTEGFVQVEAGGQGAVGFELIDLGDTLLGFNASFGNPASESFSAQLANGNAGVDIFTSLKVVNTSDSNRSLTLTAFDEQGDVLAVFGPAMLGSNQSLQRDLGEALGLGPSNGPAVAGSLRLEADGPGVIGDVVFGDPNELRFAAALPLQTELFRRAIFSQVANAVNANPVLSTFTGLALANPGDGTARIYVRVFNSDCFETGATEVVLEPGERISRVLTELVPQTAGQVLGYILIESTEPIVAQQLFGNLVLAYLSAVPPTILE